MPDGGMIRPRIDGLLLAQIEAAPEKAQDRAYSFIASSTSVDRYGDVIEQDWQLEEYWKNPVLLWGHNSRMPPIGRVTAFDPTADRQRTIAKVELAPAGLDPLTDHIAALVDLKLLRAVSVGFLPGAATERRDERGAFAGYTYTQNKLVELSLVSVPANPDAVQLARGLGIPAEHIATIFFAEPAASGLKARHRRLIAERELIAIRTRNFGRSAGRDS